MTRSSQRALIRSIAIGTAMVTAAILSGCGAASGDGPNPQPAGSDIDPALSAFLTEASEPYRGTTIEVLAISSAQAAAMETISGEFTELTGIDVNVTSVAENDLVTRAQVTLSTQSSGIDVLQTLSFFVPSYAENDWLIPVSELSANDDITFDGLDLDRYAPAAVDQLAYADEHWALPMFVATQVFYYRTDIFEEHGITPPATLDELEEVAAAIDSDDVAAIALRSGIGSTQNLFPWTAWLYNDGGSYFDSFDAATGTYSGAALDSPESIAAAERYASMLQDYGPEGGLNWAVADVTRAFLSGQVAMIQEGSPFAGTINDPSQSAVAGKVGAFAVPAGDAGAYYPSAAQGWGINRYSENTEASWLFTQWATDPSVLLHASLVAQFPAPPLVDVFDNADFREKYDFTGFLDSLKVSLSGESSPVGGPYIPALLDWQEVGQKVSVEFNKTITGQLSAKDAMTEAAKILEASTP